MIKGDTAIKKLIVGVLSIAMLALSALCGCINVEGDGGQMNKGSQETTKAQVYGDTIGDYVPFQKQINTLYEFGAGTSESGFSTYITYSWGTKIQRIVKWKDHNSTEVLEYLKGKGTLKLRYFDGEAYHNPDMTDVKANGARVLLQEPLEKGAAWEDEEGYRSSVTGVDVSVKTKAGSYDALEVTVETPADGKGQKYYYARGVGLVKFMDGDTEYSLDAINEGAGVDFDVDIFFPGNDGKWVIDTRTIKVRTNPNFKPLFETEMRKAPEGAMPLLTENGRFMRLDIFPAKGTSNVDMDKKFLNETNENDMKIILQGIVNTVGRFFEINEAEITIEQQPYIDSIMAEKP